MIPFSWSILLILICLFAGFASGRRIGIRAGTRKGEAKAKITLRQESLLAGKCKTCDRPFQ